MNKILKYFTIFLISIFLISCGSGGASTHELNNKPNDTQDNNPTTDPKDKPKDHQDKDLKIKPNSISGRVVDGYIKNATVFLDTNYNFKLDDKEVSTTTDEYGRFLLENVDLTKINRQNSIVAVGGIDVDTNKNFNQILAFTPTQEDIKKTIFLTPASTIITRTAINIVMNGGFGGFSITNFKSLLLNTLDLKEEDLSINPLQNNKIYKINQSIQKAVELSSNGYENFIQIFSTTTQNLKDAINNSSLQHKDISVKVLDFYQNLKDDELTNKRVNIAKKVQEQVDNKKFDLISTDDIKKDDEIKDVEDIENPDKNTTAMIELKGKLIHEYNKQATIFHDKNKNKALDSDEKQVITDNNGNFSIKLSLDDISKRYSLVAINGKNANNQTQSIKNILYTTPMANETSYITPINTFHTSAATAVTRNKMVDSLISHPNFSQAVATSLGIEFDDFGKNYLDLDNNLKLYKISMSIEDIIKALSLSVKDNTSYHDKLVENYILLSSNISMKTETLKDVLERFKKNNNINEKVYNYIMMIYNTYQNATKDDIKNAITKNKIDKILQEISKNALVSNKKIAQNKTYKLLQADDFSKYQWHLYDQGAIVNTQNIVTKGGNDLGVDELYAKDIVGKNVQVRIVDDGLYANHEDLKGVVSIADSYNAQTNQNDPTPDKKTDTHGTQVAGLISADGKNNVGLRGVAPYSTISAFKLKTTGNGGISFSIEDLQKAWLGGNDKISIVNNSWGSTVIDRHIEEEKIIKEGATTKRVVNGEALGRIYLFASGNGGFNQEEKDIFTDDSVTSYLRNSQYAISVAAIRNENIVTQYSTQGSNVLVSGYGGGVKYATAALMATTAVPGTSKATWSEDTKKQYTFGFNGTSAATPVVSGALALVMQECPNLSYRDVKWLIATTAKKVDENYDGLTLLAPNVPPYKTAPKKDLDNGFGYIKNASGLSHSNYYGYGLINPALMIKKCTSSSFKRLPKVKSIEVKTDTTSLSSLNVSANNTLEEMLYVQKDENEYINKIEWVGLTIYADIKNLPKTSIVLISPSGTITRLLTNSKTALTKQAKLELGYRFGSVAFIDENPYGIWRILVKSADPQDDGRIKKIKLQIVGHERNW